jgi:hypothetical protein
VLIHLQRDRHDQKDSEKAQRPWGER